MKRARCKLEISLLMGSFSNSLGAANTACDRYPALQPFEHYEHGKDADPSFPNLLKEGSQIEDITASIGAEVSGIQLSQLDDKGKDELALLVAQKKVVAFRDQDFASLPIEKALEFGRYFGRLHIHPTRFVVCQCRASRD
jgi:sulfonate dioxygenase